MEPTKFKTDPRSMYKPQERGLDREYFRAVHTASSSNIVINAGHSLGRAGGLYAVAGFGTSGGRLPDDSGNYVLSRSQPGRDVFVGHGTSRTAVRTSPWLEADDVHQFFWLLRHHLTVQSRS